MKKKGKRAKAVKRDVIPEVTPEVINPPAVNPTKYQIIRAFNVNNVMYNLGEEIPEISPAEIDLLFQTGRIAKVVNGQLVSNIVKARYSPTRLQALSKSAYPIIRGFLLNSLVCTEDMEELLKLCVDQNRPALILNNIGLVIEERKLAEKVEEPHIDIETEVCPEPTMGTEEILGYTSALVSSGSSSSGSPIVTGSSDIDNP